MPDRSSQPDVTGAGRERAGRRVTLAPRAVYPAYVLAIVIVRFLGHG